MVQAMRSANVATIIGLVALLRPVGRADEPPALNPFGARPAQREDAEPGYVELSDGSILAGSIYLTRDARLRIYDSQLKRNRDVPLRVIERIECHVEKEWLEKEWRFREAANDRKVYTGRSYPARIYVHTITLRDGRTIRGPLSAPIYVQSDPHKKAARFILHKRDKGPVGTSLKELVYVRKVELGYRALQEAKAKERQKEPTQTDGSPS